MPMYRKTGNGVIYLIHINFTLSYLETYIVAINFMAFLLYGYDKLQSIKSSKFISRVSERSLLLSTFIGGSIGSFMAMLLFRHKIKKPSFILKFSIVVIIQMVLIYVYLKEGVNLL